MSEPEELTGDVRLMAELALGRTLAEAAVLAGMSARSARRRMASADFRGTLHEARQEAMGVSLARMGALVPQALDTLEALLGAESESVRLGAARTILGMVPGVRLNEPEPAEKSHDGLTLEELQELQRARLKDLSTEELESLCANIEERRKRIGIFPEFSGGGGGAA